MRYTALLAFLVTGVSFVGCENRAAYVQASTPTVAVAATPQPSQQEMLREVLQNYLSQSAPGTVVTGANFLPLTNSLYIAQANMTVGNLPVKKNFTMEAVGDQNAPQWQVEPANDATLQATMARYGIGDEVNAIYRHPQYYTPTLFDAVLRWHYMYDRPAPIYWGAVPVYGYSAWGFTPMPVYRTYYRTVITRYPTTHVRTVYMAPRPGVTVYRSPVVTRTPVATSVTRTPAAAPVVRTPVQTMPAKIPVANALPMKTAPAQVVRTPAPAPSRPAPSVSRTPVMSGRRR